MEINIRIIIFFLTILATALSAGLFYGWVVSIIPGTKSISDQAYLETMQSINRAILNPGFFAVFMGAMFLLIASTFLQYKVKVDSTFYLTLCATLVYIIGTIGITMLGNVPLNNIVEAFDLSTFSAEDFQQARLDYEAKWNALNLTRTIAAIVAFMLLVVAMLKN